jgi:hypothetical protein
MDLAAFVLDCSCLYFFSSFGTEVLAYPDAEKVRVPQIQGVKGEAVLDYREPLTTRQRRTSSGDAVPSAFPEGGQQGEFFIDCGKASFEGRCLRGQTLNNTQWRPCRNKPRQPEPGRVKQ